MRTTPRAGGRLVLLAALFGLAAVTLGNKEGCEFPGELPDQMCETAADCASKMADPCTGSWVCEAGSCECVAGGEAPVCEQHRDCADGERCVDGRCEPRLCQNEHQCGEGQFCDKSVCLPPPGCAKKDDCPAEACFGQCAEGEAPECTEDDDCYGGKVCVDGECVLPPVECTDDDDCSHGKVCVDGECVLPPDECTSDADCPYGERCLDGRCVPKKECVSQEDCPDGKTCIYGKCVLATPPEQCFIDAHCPYGQVCVEGDCVIPGAECTDDDDCVSGEICFEGQCVSDDLCLSDDDCPIGTFCNAADICLPPPGCEPGQPCAAVCYGYCVEKPDHDLCASDLDCPSGTECNAADICLPPPGCEPGEPCIELCYGYCVPKDGTCEVDADCGHGQMCVPAPCEPCECPFAGSCSCPPCDAGGMCVKKWEPHGQLCASSADCPAGRACNAEDLCLPPPGCDPETQYCAAVCYGYCVLPVEDGPCTSDLNCPAGQVCDLDTSDWEAHGVCRDAAPY